MFKFNEKKNDMLNTNNEDKHNETSCSTYVQLKLQFNDFNYILCYLRYQYKYSNFIRIFKILFNEHNIIYSVFNVIPT